MTTEPESLTEPHTMLIDSAAQAKLLAELCERATVNGKDARALADLYDKALEAKAAF
jgi:hypothetical protein